MKKIKVKDIFGKLKNWKKPTKQIMKETDKELDSKIIKKAEINNLFGIVKRKMSGQKFKDFVRDGWK